MSQSSATAQQRQLNSQIKPGTCLVSTTCPYCGVGCGVDVSVEVTGENTAPTAHLTGLTGTADHPANFGRLCVKGSQLLATNSQQGRMARPTIQGQPVSWSVATNAVAQGFQRIIAEHGPDAVAFYVSGQLLTEDYYVANKLMKGYIGSANIDTNSRLCMSSAVSAYKRAFGADAVPCCYDDLELCDLLVLVGSNAAWTHPVLFQRIERAKKRNPAMRVVLIDPRQTASAELADLQLNLKPGTDVALFNGLLAYLADHQGLDEEFIHQHCDDFAPALAASRALSLKKVAELCDVPLADLCQFYQWFLSSEKVVSAYSMGVNQSSSGVDKANAIINCHLASGKLGREGCGPFSLTGQPNAMGGREVGGLANMLACHMELDNPQHRQIVQQYWQSPTIADKTGLKAVDLFEQIRLGKVKAVWIMATNPLVSMPNRDKIIAALKQCELVVVSDCVASNDTLQYAHIALPASSWSEKSGTVTNSERRISRQRGLLAPFAESKHDWQIICEVAKAMGFAQGFNFTSVHQIFSEYAGLTAADNHGSRDLDLSGLSQLSAEQYEQLSPLQWPVNQANPNGSKRLFGDKQFYTANKKARFIALSYRPAEQVTSAAFPWILNSGRLRDQWHTMTRTGKAAELCAHESRPYVAIHPQDAAKLGLQNAELVQLRAAHSQSDNKVIVPLRLESRQRRGELFAPIHWSATNASSATIAQLYSDAHDPLSGQPELKHAAVALEKVSFSLSGLLYVRHQPSLALLNAVFDYFVLTPLAEGYKVYFASQRSVAELRQGLQLNLPRCNEWLTALSDKGGNLCGLSDGQLSVAMFGSSRALEQEDSWLNQLMGEKQLSAAQLNSLLRGEPDLSFRAGPIVCSCFKVGRHTINAAIAAGCDSVDALGRELKCGTNCGSCKSELSQMLKQQASTSAPPVTLAEPVAAQQIAVLPLL